MVLIITKNTGVSGKTLERGIAENPIRVYIILFFVVERFLNILSKNKNVTIVMNNCVTNHIGQDKSNWCPFKNGVTKKLYKFKSIPQNLPVSFARIMVTIA